MSLKDMVRLVIGSAVLSLVITLITAALSAAGVINMALAHVLLFLAWLVAMIGIVTSEIVCRCSKKRFWAIAVISAVVLSGGFFYLDRWTVKAKEQQDFATRPQVVKNLPVPPAFAYEKPRVALKREPPINIHGNNNHVGNQTLICPNGICNGGDNYGDQRVYNAAPIPIVSWNQADGSDKTNVVITLKVDHSMEIPAFVAICDRPCKSSGASSLGYSQSADLKIVGNPNATGVVLLAPRPLGPGIGVTWGIKSLDGETLKINNVLKLDSSGLPPEFR
jgi:hypothetical protein